VLAYLRA